MRYTCERSNCRCSRQPLAELLRGELDEKESSRVAAHLDDCEICQQKLTRLAGDPRWWLDVGRLLDPAVGGLDALTDNLSDDSPCDSEFHVPDAEQQLLHNGLLAASDKPGVLGTLGRYEVQCVLGTGGTGIVLKAADLELQRTVAIKVLSPALATSGAARRRFAREGQAVAAVAHENVVAVHHVEAGGRLPYLVMHYVDGDSLQDLVVRDGPLDVTTALRMTAQIASALAAAHDQGLVHRDVKPANILVGATGQRVWITDFGLARAVDDASLTRTGFIAGTPHYMSPEQARGEAVRSSSDLFGLGSVLYFMLTGRPPFRADRTLAILNRICNEPHRPVREVNPDVPQAIAALVDRLLNKSVIDRLSDAETARTHCLQLLTVLTSPDGDLDQSGLADRAFEFVEPACEHTRPSSFQRHLPWVIVGILLISANLVAGAFLVKGWPLSADDSRPTQPAEILAEADGPKVPESQPSVKLNRGGISNTPTTSDQSGQREANESSGDAASELAVANVPAPLDERAGWSDGADWSNGSAKRGNNFSQANDHAFESAQTQFSSEHDDWKDVVRPLVEPPELMPRSIDYDSRQGAAMALSVWDRDLASLHDSVELLEAEIDRSASHHVFDVVVPMTSNAAPFDAELRRIEEGLHSLDNEPKRTRPVRVMSPFIRSPPIINGSQ